MNMEIKVGDKVRVSKDAPRIYTQNCLNLSLHNTDFEVANIEDGCANIQNKDGILTIAYVIPTKYLTKVEDEAKESKFKVGDKVRKKKWDKDTTISYVEWHGTWQTYVYRFAEQEYGFNCHKEEDITLVSRRAKEPKFKTGDCVKISFEWNDLPIGEKLVIKRLETIDCRDAYMYSIEGYGRCVIESMLHPYAEPTAPTIKVGDFVRVLENLHEPICLDVERHLEITNMPPHAVSQKEWKVISVEMRRDCAGRIYTLKHDDSFIYNIPEDCVELVQPKEQTEAEKKPNVGSIKIPVEVDLTDSYWDTYTADLAHDLALKVANKYSDPKEAADYAVSVAKAVVENLKKK